MAGWKQGDQIGGYCNNPGLEVMVALDHGSVNRGCEEWLNMWLYQFSQCFIANACQIANI